jgi:predicted nucleotidyltransferase
MNQNKFGLLTRDIKSIIGVLRIFPEIEKAVIFGSRAMGNYKKGSDIDIAIYGQGITNQLVIKIRSILNEEQPIPYFVDLVGYNVITNENLKKHIDTFGIEIFNYKNLTQNALRETK